MRNLIQRVRVEYYIIIAFVLTFISFSIPTYDLPNYKSMAFMTYVFDAPIGIIIFTIVYGGFAAALLYCTNDNIYSKRAKRALRFSTWFLLVFFVLVAVWLLVFKNGNFSLSVLIFIATLIFIALIAFLYQEYNGQKNPSLFGGKIKDENTDFEKYPKLEDLKYIYEEGIITEEEYVQKRKELLYSYIHNENKLNYIKKPKGFLLTIILGIIGIILSFPILSYFGFVISIIGLIYVNQLMKKTKKATAGLVLNLIAFGFALISIISTVLMVLTEMQIIIS